MANKRKIGVVIALDGEKEFKLWGGGGKEGGVGKSMMSYPEP